MRHPDEKTSRMDCETWRQPVHNLRTIQEIRHASLASFDLLKVKKHCTGRGSVELKIPGGVAVKDAAGFGNQIMARHDPPSIGQLRPDALACFVGAQHILLV